MNNIATSEIEENQAYDLIMVDVRYEETIGGKLFLARKSKGLTLQVVGAKLNVRASHLSGVENNKVGVSLDLFRRMLDLYDVSADAILSRPLPEPEDNAIGVSEEAEILADVIDALPKNKRLEVLDVVRAMAAHVRPDAGDKITDAEAQIRLNGLLNTAGANDENGGQPQAKTKRKARR